MKNGPNGGDCEYTGWWPGRAKWKSWLTKMPLGPSACGVLILLADQWSKRTVQTYAAHRVVALGPLLRIRFVPHRHNLYAGAGSRAALLLAWALALVSAVILHRSSAWFQGPAALFGLGLAFGGAASNLLDILWRRYVIDFIDLGWWPVFNLADMAIIAGLATAFLW